MNASSLPKIVTVCGPTGVGKTSFAIALARQFGGEIVGADSMQIYRRMDIGTAKPTAEEQAAVRHHMVDIIDPDEAFDAATYGHQAHGVVQKLLAAGIPAIVVGGTGLYVKALVYGLFRADPVDPGVRRELRARLDAEGAAALHLRLQEKDPRAAARLHPNDGYRILRALEVIETTGRSISDLQKAHRFRQARYQTLDIGLSLPRDALYARIDRRVDVMIGAGLREEVRALLALGYGPELKAMQSLGYRHMIAYLKGGAAWDETLRTLKRDHRRYAKRQLTWFKAVAGTRWLTPDQVDAGIDMVASFFGRVPQALRPDGRG